MATTVQPFAAARQRLAAIVIAPTPQLGSFRVETLLRLSISKVTTLNVDPIVIGPAVIIGILIFIKGGIVGRQLPLSFHRFILGILGVILGAINCSLVAGFCL